MHVAPAATFLGVEVEMRGSLGKYSRAWYDASRQRHITTDTVILGDFRGDDGKCRYLTPAAG